MTRLSIAFFLSGFGALLCQIVWQRMLGIFAGSDTISAALVVGAFLSGLGLGSILGARWADRLAPRQALLGFALCELGVAACALVSKPLLYDGLAMGLAPHVTSAPAIFALCFAGLVVPTTLMGASLPLLARAVTLTLEGAAARIGGLYGWNTLGAGLGALLGGWWIVGSVGYVGALRVAAGLDVAAAALALTLLRATPAEAPSRDARAESAPVEAFGSLGLWCVLVFLSGYVIVALEIVWVRLLGQFGQYHAYLFPTVLGTFLLADGFGMALAARMLRRIGDPRPAFFITQGLGFLLGIALLGALWVAIGLPPLRDWLGVDFDRFGSRELAWTTGIIVAVVAPPSFVIGMTFPFVQRAVQQDLASVGARVGWVQLANILGNAAGSLLTGLVTFHWLGTAGTLLLLCLLSMALLGFRIVGAREARPALMALFGLTALAAMALPSNGRLWARMHGIAGGTLMAWGEDRSGVVLWRERATLPRREGGRFFIMGHGQGFVPFLDTHVLLGMLGPLLHPDPQRVLAIGVGSGGTPWGATVSPTTREIRGVELVAPVLDALSEIASARPDSGVAALLADPRVRLEYGDGRQALMRGDDLFDVIEADAILPQSSHSGLLYSAEFLQAVKRRLAPGGLYVQWAPSWRVMDTFAAAFPYAVLLRPVQVMIGSDRPIALDEVSLAALLRRPDVVAHARRGNPASGGLLPLVAGAIERWGPDTPRGGDVLSDMFPRDEFFLNHAHLDAWRPREHPR